MTVQTIGPNESFYEDPIEFLVDVTFDTASPVQTLLGGSFHVDARSGLAGTSIVTGTATYVSPTRIKVQFAAKALVPATWDIQTRTTPSGYNPQVVSRVSWQVHRSNYVS